jgi:L-cysteine/cystine lyase
MPSPLSTDLKNTEVSRALAYYRQNFPALANKTYFNYGGQGPLPLAARTAIVQAYDEVQQSGPFSGKALDWIFAEIAQTRTTLAQNLGVAPQTITLTESVSVGCNIPLWGLDWQAGDRLILTDCEHPGIVATVQQLQRRLGVEVITLPLLAHQQDPLPLIAEALDQPRTRMLVISHLLWNTGKVLPLAEIVQLCHHNPAGRVAILVDAAQSVGVLPLNLGELGADFYAFTGHKWCCGPEGVGGLYISPEAFESLQPTFIGWRGIINDPQGIPVDWKPDGRKFEVATAAFPLCMGLTAALALHSQWGTVPERYHRICQLSHYLWQQLQTLPGVKCLGTAPPDAGLVSFQLRQATTDPTAHQALVEFLESRGILVRSIPYPNCVRAGVHYFTLVEECDRLVAAIGAFLEVG